MNRVLRKWLGRGLLASIVLVAVAITWLLGSTAGTRWLLARTVIWLPEALTLGQVEGSLLGGVHFEQATWRDDSLNLSVSDLFVHVELQPLLRRQLRVEELDAGAVSISLPAAQNEDTTFTLPEFSMPVRVSVASFALRNLEISRGGEVTALSSIAGSGGMRGSRIDLDSLSISAESFAFEVDGNMLLASPHPANLRGTWSLDTESGVEFSGRIEIDGDTNRYGLTHELDTPFVVATSGSLAAADGEVSLDIRNEWTDASWPVAGEILMSRSGSLSLRGNLDDWDVVLDSFVHWPGLPEVSLTLEGAGDSERLSITQMEAESGSSRIGINGVAARAPAPNLDIEFDVPFLDPELLDTWLDVPFPSESIRGTGNIRWTANLLELRDAEFAIGSNTLAMNGTFGVELDVNARFFLLAVDELLPAASGTLQGELVVSGTPDAFTGSASVRGNEISWQDFGAGEFVADIQNPAADTYVINVEMQEFSAGAVVMDSAEISLSGGVADHDARTRIRIGETGINAELSGALEASAWSGTLSSLELENPAMGSWTSQQAASIAASAAGAEVSRLCLDSNSGTACVEGEYAVGGPVSLDVALSGIPPRALPLPLPDSVQVGGMISADAHGEILDGTFNGSGTLQWNDALLETTVEGEELSLEFSPATATVSLADNRLNASMQIATADAAATAASEFHMNNVFDSASAIGGEAVVTVADAGVFAFLLPDIAEISGQVNGQLNVAGNLQLPEVLGSVSLSDGSFRARQTGVQIRDINLTLEQRAPGQLQLRGSALSGDGRVSVTGDTVMSSDTGIRTELKMEGTDFEVARLPDLAVTASPDLTVVFDDRLTSITGELGIPRADIVVRTLPDTAVSPSRDAVVHRAGAVPAERRGRRTDVDVLASLGDQVSFSGFGLTAGIEGGLRVRGGTHAPFVGTGQLALRNGRYKAYGQNLEIERGELIFNGPLDSPELDVRATRMAGEVTAGIRLNGTPDNLRSEVFSEPELSDAEALSYLLTGRPLGGSGEDGAALNKAAFALGLSGAGKVASQVRAGLGLETLQIEGGADDGRIIAGKRFGNRLLVEYGYGIIDKLGTLLLRYQLNDRLVLESRTGTVSNLDILYSVKKQ